MIPLNAVSADERSSDEVKPAPNWVERQNRVTTILLVGRLLHDGGDHLCRVRNVSTGGALIECEAALTTHEHVRVELRNRSVVEGRIVWTRPGRAGLAFDSGVNIADLLHPRAPDGDGRHPRAPRLTTDCPVLVWHLGKTSSLRLRDLSQSGCRLALSHPLPIGSEVRITVPGLAPRHATLRWTHGGEGGIEGGFAFQEVLSFAELAAWERDPEMRFPEQRGE